MYISGLGQWEVEIQYVNSSGTYKHNFSNTATLVLSDFRKCRELRNFQRKSQASIILGSLRNIVHGY